MQCRLPRALTVWVALVGLLGCVSALYEYHLDKGLGVAFKYPSELLLTTNRIIKSKGVLYSIYKLESFQEWDMVVTIKLDGNLKGQQDGYIINLSPREIGNNLFAYSDTGPNDFGYTNKLEGLVIAIRAAKTGPSTTGYAKYNVYSRYFDRLTKFKPGLLPEAFNMDDQAYAKDIEAEKSNNEILVYLRYEKGGLQVRTKTSLTRSPELLYKVANATKISSFYLGFSGAITESLVGCKIPNIFYKSDKQNSDVVYFEPQDFHEKADVFNYIHYMHDVIAEDSKEADEDIPIGKINDEAIIEKMLAYQTESLDNIKPAVKILSVAEQEVASLFNYMQNYRNVSKEYLISVVAQVDKMLKSTNKQFEYLSKDVDKLNLKFSKSSVVGLADKVHASMTDTISKIKDMDDRFRRASDTVGELKTSLAETTAFVDTFRNILETLPARMQQDLEQSVATQAKLNVSSSSVLRNILYGLVLIILCGFGLILAVLRKDDSKQMF